jgi:hypothetical protein
VLSNDPNDKESAALLKSDIAALRKEKAHWASAYATFAEALGHARSKPERAASGLILAREQLESGHMLLMAAVCDFCLGRIQGGDEGASLIETARDFMTAQGIKNPDCFAQHCGPLPQNQS